MSKEVAIAGQIQPGQMNRDQIDLLKTTICKDATDDELRLFSQVCASRGLDPFSRQIYAVKRQGVMTIQTSIDGFRLIAERTGKYRGQIGPLWCGDDGEWKDVWLAKTPPAAARVGVIRSDFQEPLWAVARFSSYSAGQNLWNKMPEVMIGKCAESLALRKAFPQELGGLYSPEEMDQAEPVAPYDPPAPKPTVTATIIEAEPRPWKTFKEMLAVFENLKGRGGEDLYYKVLRAHGNSHANQFTSADDAVACYRELSAIVARAEVKDVKVEDATQ